MFSSTSPDGSPQLHFCTIQVAAGLTDDDVADALGERSQRIYDKYGTMMLNTEGFSATGLERKATCKALFQKVLYLAEHEALVKAGSEAANKVNLRTVRGMPCKQGSKSCVVYASRSSNYGAYYFLQYRSLERPRRIWTNFGLCHCTMW